MVPATTDLPDEVMPLLPAGLSLRRGETPPYNVQGRVTREADREEHSDNYWLPCCVRGPPCMTRETPQHDCFWLGVVLWVLLTSLLALLLMGLSVLIRQDLGTDRQVSPGDPLRPPTLPPLFPPPEMSKTPLL
mmetsp:Transcript_21971/g.38643  ORF Transcript_21971/g.38643 Transcript_21971/m.38643 type:complete len:133 (-) Transcript_21971:202-600(-)